MPQSGQEHAPFVMYLCIHSNTQCQYKSVLLGPNGGHVGIPPGQKAELWATSGKRRTYLVHLAPTSPASSALRRREGDEHGRGQGDPGRGAQSLVCLGQPSKGHLHPCLPLKPSSILGPFVPKLALALAP